MAKILVKFEDNKVTVEYRPPLVYKDGPGGDGRVEHAAFVHLHSWKSAKTWKFQKDGYYGKRFIFRTNGAGEPKKAVLTMYGTME